MNHEVPSEENQEVLKNRNFEEIYSRALENEPGGLIEYQVEYPKHEFLEWLVKEKGFLLHGSNNPDIGELEPRLANDSSKEFGNNEGVYAVEDPVLPLFYSIKDTEKFRGVAKSGVSEIEEGGEVKKKYYFAVTDETLKKEPWSSGAVYLLPRETFVQGTDDEGELIDEWISKKPVQPVAKLATTPEDFPYLNEISPISES